MSRFYKILGFLILLLQFNQVFAFEIVYPKTSQVTIDSPTTFFVGNEQQTNTLYINNEPVKLHQTGAFFHPVNLNEGENIFEINNGEEVTTYNIFRPKVETSETDDKPIVITKYEKTIPFATNTDNVPMRSIPYDGGINRLEHYEKGIPFNVVGEYGDFYQVQLARDDYAWIGKQYLTKISGYNNSPAKIEGYTYEETPQKRIYSLKLSKKVPYILSEARSYVLKGQEYIPQNDGFDLVVYNVKNQPDDTFSFHINPTGKPFGYKAYYKSNRELVIEIKKFPQIIKTSPLKNIKITIDAGHGGSEFGAIGCLGDKEKDINLEIAKKLQTELENKGAKVYMTRTSDVDLSLNDRVKISKEKNSDIFISIHNNALPDSLAYSGRSGTGVYYFYPQSSNLAQNLLKSITTELDMVNDKVRQESFAVIRNSESISVLLELGYMIVPEDNAQIITPEFQQRAVLSIIHGLEKYLNEI